MAISVQEGVPASLIQGDAASFKVSDSNFPAGTWTATIGFRDLTGAVVSFSGAQSGTSHLFTLSNGDTAKLKAGANVATLAFSDGTNRQSGAAQMVNVIPDPTAGTPESFSRKQVVLLQKVIQTFNSTTLKEVNFTGQSFVRADIDKYQAQLAEWERRVADEDQQTLTNAGVPQSRFIPTVFR